jgi:hypothetical protein
MAMTRLKVAIPAVALAAAVVFLLVQNSKVVTLREDNQTLRQRLDQLTADSERLSNSLTQAASPSSKDRSGELLKLRGEVTALRKQTSELGKLQEENTRLRSALSSAKKASNSNEDAEPPPTEERLQGYARMNDARAYILALMLQADGNQQRLATNLDQIAPFLPKDHPPTGTNEFDIVFQGPREGLTNSSSIILLRERQPRQQSDGRWTKAYGFLDGHSEIHTEPAGNFDTYERQHLWPPPALGQ